MSIAGVISLVLTLLSVAFFAWWALTHARENRAYEQSDFAIDLCNEVDAGEITHEEAIQRLKDEYQTKH